MENIYRIKYKHGDFEVEVESTDKNFVETKLLELTEEKRIKKQPIEEKSKVKTSDSSSIPVKPNDEESGLDIVSVVNGINGADNYNIIDENIITKRDVLPRILLVFYFANKLYPDAYITTTDVEKVTNQLGIRIQYQNVGKQIKKNQKYFTASSVRKRGIPAKYKINRQGKDEFEKIVKVS